MMGMETQIFERLLRMEPPQRRFFVTLLKLQFLNEPDRIILCPSPHFAGLMHPPQHCFCVRSNLHRETNDPPGCT